MIDTQTRSPETGRTEEPREHPLELTAEEMRSLVDAVLGRIVPHIESLPSQPVSDTLGGLELARSLAEPMPEAGAPISELLDLIFERAVQKRCHLNLGVRFC